MAGMVLHRDIGALADFNNAPAVVPKRRTADRGVSLPGYGRISRCISASTLTRLIYKISVLCGRAIAYWRPEWFTDSISQR